MNCKYCGKALAKSHKFCPNCGASVLDEEKAEVVEQEVNEKVKNKKTQGFTIAGFVLSLVGICNLSILCSILGLIFSSIARAHFNPEIHKKRGLATAGLAISIVALSLGIITLFAEVMETITLL